MKKIFGYLGAAVVAGVAMSALFFPESRADSARFSPYVSDEGSIMVPENYRNEFAFIGTWAVANKDDQAGAAGIHNVYTQKSSVEAFMKTGEFPDGAIIVKELFEAETGSMTTGTVSWVAETSGWFVMVKDREGRFRGNKLWGNGWGWSYFTADDPTKTVSTDFRADCLGCHIPAKETDWIYLNGYPQLKNSE